MINYSTITSIFDINISSVTLAFIQPVDRHFRDILPAYLTSPASSSFLPKCTGEPMSNAMGLSCGSIIKSKTINPGHFPWTSSRDLGFKHLKWI